MRLPPDPDKPDFFPFDSGALENQRREIRLLAEKLGTNVRDYPDKAARAEVFEALKLLCCWKYMNQIELTPIERFTLHLPGLGLEVNNGGFHQYFSNSAGDDWDIILWGLRESKDEDGLRRFKEVLAVFPNSQPYRNRVHRNCQLDSLRDRQWQVFNSFDEKFYDEPFPDGKMSGDLILSRIHEFRPQWPDERKSK
jgi:hypothetical protein